METNHIMLHEMMKVVTVTHSPHILLHFVSSFFVVITYNSDTHAYDRQKKKKDYSACTQFFGQYSYTHRNTTSSMLTQEKGNLFTFTAKHQDSESASYRELCIERAYSLNIYTHLAAAGADLLILLLQ